MLASDRGKTLFDEQTASVDEDNILKQLQDQGYKGLGINGLSLWSVKYKPYFEDLLMVEGGSIMDTFNHDELGFEGFFEKYASEEYDFINYHVAGLDHIHHDQGVNTDDADLKATILDDHFKHVMETIDTNTTLFIFGDHGCAVNGLHGDNSIEERTSVMFVYAKGQTFLEEQGRTKMLGAEFAPMFSQLGDLNVPYSSEGHIFPET